MLNEDYKEILENLSDNKVKFLVVGAYAMGAYGYPRATGDFDIWIDNSLENSKKIYHALAQFGAPLMKITEETFCEKNIIFQIGVAPRRIDIITAIDGIDFKKAYSHRKKIKLDRITVPFISLSDLIKNKLSTGREKDKLDVKYLRKAK